MHADVVTLTTLCSIDSLQSAAIHSVNEQVSTMCFNAHFELLLHKFIKIYSDFVFCGKQLMWIMKCDQAC